MLSAQFVLAGSPDTMIRLRAVRLMRKLIGIPDSRLELLVEAGAVHKLMRCVVGSFPRGDTPPAGQQGGKDPKAKAKDAKGKGQAAAADDPEAQDPQVHMLQEAAADVLSILMEYVPSAAKAVSRLSHYHQRL